MYDFLTLPVEHVIDLTIDPAPSLVFDNDEVIDPDLRTSHTVKTRLGFDT